MKQVKTQFEMELYYFYYTLFAITSCIVSKSEADGRQGVRFSVSQHNKCLAADNLNILTAFASVSLQDCVSGCGNRTDCLAVNYRRRRAICELLSSENGNLVNSNGQTGPCVLVLKSDMREIPSCSCRSGEVCEENDCTTKECQTTEPRNTEVAGNLNAVGSHILYNCIPGLVNTGHGNATCLQGGTWSNQPQCVSDCGDPASVSFATRSFTSTTENSTVTYTCLASYTRTGGDLQLACGSDGLWNGALPTCTIDCGTPATVSFANRSFTSTTENSVVTYSCQSGYTQTAGDLQLVCGSDGQWGGMKPTCTRDCGTPATVPGASRSFISTTENSVVTYTCLTSFTQTGGDLQLSCGSDGQWSGVLPTCTIDCGPPATVPGATRTFTSTTENSIVTYTCLANYIHTGGELQLACGTDTQWSGVLPTCTIDCGAPATMPEATLSVTSTTENSIVTYTCLTGYSQTAGDLQLVCGSDGQWSGTLPKCTIDCGTPSSVSGASLSVTSTTVNSVVTYTCLTAYTHTGGDLELVCHIDGNWKTTLPTCVPGCPELPDVPNSVLSSGSKTLGVERTYTCGSGKYFGTGTGVMTTTCQSGGLWSNMNIICPRDSAELACPGCGILRDCEDVQSLGLTVTGTYLIYPTGIVGIQVRCDMDTSTGGWTIIQRRISDSNFYQTWSEYKNGFGSVDSNYWLGNDNIATLTSQNSYMIRFDLYDQANAHKYAEYSTFSITDESLNYKLTVYGYSGNAGDSLSVHNGQMFTTKDADNDPADNTNCAVLYTGAWWFSACHDSNLNGVYGSSESGKGLIWYTFTGLTNSLSTTEMKIKRK